MGETRFLFFAPKAPPHQKPHMTDSPKSDNSCLNLLSKLLSSAQTSPILSSKLWRRGAIGLSLILLVGTGGALLWLWFFVNRDLESLVAKELEKLIDRPIKIGSIEQYYLTGLRIGASAIPPTETDPDFVKVPTVNVSFEPLTLLFRRTLNLKIALQQPTIYIAQDIAGNWLSLNSKESALAKTSNVNITTVQITNGQVMLLPNGKIQAQLFDQKSSLMPYIIMQNFQAKVNFNSFQKNIIYQLATQPNQGGNLTIKSQINLNNLATKIHLQGKNLDAANMMPLMPNLPFRVAQGKLNADLQVNLAANTVTFWQGYASFTGISGQLGKLGQPISQVSGQVNFADLRVFVRNTQAVYGNLPLKISGSIKPKSDYNLAISIPSLSLADYLHTFKDIFKVNFPFPLTGSVSTELQVTGSWSQPILSGMLVTTTPGKVDLIDVKTANARFKMQGENLRITDIQIEPTLGGFIYGRGNIQLGEIPQLGFYLLGENLPGDAIAQLYRPEKLPFTIGRIHGSAKILGQADRPTALVNWRSPEMKYPGRGELTIAKETILLNNSIFQVAGGTVNATGAMMLDKDRWQAFFKAQNIQLNQLNLSNTNPAKNSIPENYLPGNITSENNTPVYPAILSGGLRISGKLTSLTPANIQGSGEVELTTADAKVTGRGTLDKGKWLASLGVQTLPGKALPLNQLIPDLLIPMKLSSGTLELSGTLD